MRLSRCPASSLVIGRLVVELRRLMPLRGKSRPNWTAIERLGQAVRLAGAPALSALLCGCSAQGVLSPRGPVGQANRAIMLNSLAVMLAIVIPTIIAAFLIAWWFREGNRRARYNPKFVYSGRIEAVVWGVPLLTIVFLSGLIWTGSHRLDPYRRIDPNAPQLEVQVVSLDWKWLFIYPGEGVASVNQLVVPVGRPIHFSLTSASVMNSFFIPQLGSQIYTMNGMATQLSLRADRAGVYRGQSSQFSGDGFADMAFPVHAVSEQAYSRWIEQARQTGGVLDRETYRQLARQTRGHPPSAYGATEPGLFEAVVHQQLASRPGLQRGHGDDLEVSPESTP